MNVNSIRYRKAELEEFCLYAKPDLMMCTETKVDATISGSEFLPEEYASNIRRDRTLAILDSNLTMETHIKALSSSCFYHIRSFKQIRSSLDHDMAISVASALVSSRLDHFNSILYGEAFKSPTACPESIG